jgi:hypothetical protein
MAVSTTFACSTAASGLTPNNVVGLRSITKADERSRFSIGDTA